jgi:hypothetical protein
MQTVTGTYQTTDVSVTFSAISWAERHSVDGRCVAEDGGYEDAEISEVTILEVDLDPATLPDALKARLWGFFELVDLS